MVEELSRDEIVERVDRTVKELLLETGVSEPPVDAVVLARGLNLPDQSQRRPGRRNRGESISEPTPEQQQWDAALRIGDHLKPGLLGSLGFDSEKPRPLMGESLSKLVAEHLLLPLAWFAKDAPASGFDLFVLKETYRTAGHELIAWRFLDLPEPCIITVVDDDRVRRRRSNAWPTRRELHPVEQRCQRQVSESGRPRVVRAGGWTVQCWQVSGPDGKREVLRSVVEET